MKNIFNILLLILACTGFLSAAGTSETTTSQASGNTGIIQYLEGSVTMDGNIMQIGDKIKSGSTFSTGPDSYCEIAFGGKNIFRIQENTLAVITLESGKGNLDVQKGSLAFLLQKLSVLGMKNPEFTVKTPSAAMGVRGTAFFVKVESEDSTYICACHGTLQVKNAQGGQAEKLIGLHHNGIRFKKRSDGSYSIESPGLLYHNDGDMDNLARHIQSRILWGK